MEREASRREKARQEEQLKQIQTKQIKDRLLQISQTSYGQKMMEKFDEEVSVVQMNFVGYILEGKVRIMVGNISE